MEIAKGTICLHEHHRHVNYHITPAEAVILKLMHNKESKGTPLRDLVITGEAKEVDNFGKPMVYAEAKTRSTKVTQTVNGKKVTMDATEEYTEYTESTKARTNAAEVNRLQRKYTGNVTSKDGKTLNAFVAAFGDGAIVSLPQTFEEVKSIIGDCFTDGRAPEAPAAEQSPS